MLTDKVCSPTSKQGVVPSFSQGVGEASYAVTGTDQPGGGQVPCPMLKSARCTKLPGFKREGSVANMRN